MTDRRILPTRSAAALAAAGQEQPAGGLARGDSPRVKPLSYPGRSVERSALVRPVTTLDLTLRPGRRLGQARVRLDAGGLPGDERSAYTDVPLNYGLLRLNQTPVGRRYPVLAFGAAASPAYLRDLLDQPGRSLAIPLVRARVEGAAVGFAACTSRWGYVPATPVVRPDISTDGYVMWLDEQQVELVSEPECGFERVLVRPEDGVRVTLAESGEVLGACHMYTNTHGYLVDQENGEPLPIGPQAELLTELARRSTRLRKVFGRSPDEWVQRAARMGADEVALLFEEAEVAFRQPVIGELAGNPWHSARYDDLPPAGPPPEGTFRVGPSPDGVFRDGQSVVRMSAALAERFGVDKHVVVSPAVPGVKDGMEALALVIANPDSEESTTVEVDQVIRNAIGVEVGESVTLRSVKLHRRRWPDLIIGRPNYVTARVQVADLAIVEREVCLIDPLTLELLGIESGEEVVLEGNPDARGAIAQVRVKAFATSDEIQQRRADLDGGDFSALFPSARDALGVYPDLPWVFLDRSTRTALGLHRKLAPVRIKPSRSFQLRRELREMMLLLGIAFIGVLQIIGDRTWQAGVLLFLVAMVIFGIALRMRGRLMHRVGIAPEHSWRAASAGLTTRRRGPRRRR